MSTVYVQRYVAVFQCYNILHEMSFVLYLSSFVVCVCEYNFHTPTHVLTLILILGSGQFLHSKVGPGSARSYVRVRVSSGVTVCCSF